MAVEPHTDECVAIRKGFVSEWPTMDRLSEEQQGVVLNCPHRAHDSTRQMFAFKFHPTVGEASV